MLENRYGKFTISTAAIESHPEVVQAVLATVLVVRAEHLYHSKAIEYVAQSDKFDDVPLGEVTPEYDVDFNESTGVVTWTRKD